jgi:hypothetical protein
VGHEACFGADFDFGSDNAVRTDVGVCGDPRERID